MSACRGPEAAAVYFELARRAEAAGEDDLELRLRGAEQLLRSGNWALGERAFLRVAAELGLRPAATRVGALWRLLWRRAWVRLRGFGSFIRARKATTREPSRRELLRLEACQVAGLTFGEVNGALSAEYCTRYQLLALKLADPRRMGVALLIELAIAATVDATSRRTARLLDELAAAVEWSGDPYVQAQEQSIRAVVALARGQWARARDHAAGAMQVLRERCLGASYEIATAAVLHFLSLIYLGELRDFTRGLASLLREAEDRGDRYTQALHAAPVTLMWLIEDDPAAARREVERGMAIAAAGEATNAQLVIGQSAQAEIDLYEGEGAAANRRMDQGWRRIVSLPFMHVPVISARMLGLHGLAALAAHRAGEPDRRLVRAAGRDARRLRAIGLPWTSALARVLEAGVALATGAREAAREELERTRGELAATGMSFHAKLAERRLGELAGGAEGARAVADADAWLSAQGVRAPARLARVFFPEVV